MDIGYFALGIGPLTNPEWIKPVATTAERLGFSSIWAPEHVVLLEQYASKYPYSAGEFPMPTYTPFADPFTTLAFAAACTSKIKIATGICLVPEHNPLVLAKTVATLDRLSGGRFILGVGIGWLAEEFQALGLSFDRRAQRTREYIDVMRKLWREVWWWNWSTLRCRVHGVSPTRFGSVSNQLSTDCPRRCSASTAGASSLSCGTPRAKFAQP